MQCTPTSRFFFCKPPVFTYPSALPSWPGGTPVMVQKQLVVEPFPTGSTFFLMRALTMVLLPLLVLPRKATFICSCLVASTIVCRLFRILEHVSNALVDSPVPAQERPGWCSGAPRMLLHRQPKHALLAEIPASM